MTDPFKKIAILGVGLIGGSFALAMKAAGAVTSVVSANTGQACLEHADSLGILDAIMPTVAEAVQGADIVFIAVPVSQTFSVLSSIAPHLSAHTLITDAGSTKLDVIASARRALGASITQFIPGHPIAGSEQSGPGAARADLYLHKKVVLTSLPENRPEDLERVAVMWRCCGASIHHLSPEQHDDIFASVSHLPHLLAYALVNALAQRPDAASLFAYAGSGFRDFTRIAGSSPTLWRDISFANQSAILGALDHYMQQLCLIRDLLVQGDALGLEKIYHHAQQVQQTMQTLR